MELPTVLYISKDLKHIKTAT